MDSCRRVVCLFAVLRLELIPQRLSAQRQRTHLLQVLMGDGCSESHTLVVGT